MDSKHGARKDAENKRLAKFYAMDRPPRKRLRTLLEFLKNPSPADSGNIVGMAVNALTGGQKAADAASLAENAVAIAEFWADAGNSSMLFAVLNDCVTELEGLYSPHENAFRKIRKKALEAEDWNEVFEGLEVLIRNNIVRIHEEWNYHGFTLLFMKLLKRENHSLIKKYAFRCLALYTDALRNVQQLAAMPSYGSTLRGGSVANLSAAETDGNSDEEGDGSRGGSTLLSFGSKRKSVHLELLRESADFSPYGGGSIQLPDKFMNDGYHVEGWARSGGTQAEEPVDMLKFIMDLSLEREDPKLLNHPKINHKARGERFVFWCELIMRFYMPLLYPKVCIKVKLKEEGDPMGFFHHCPGSFQRVVARWVYKLRAKDECMEVLWSRRDFSEVIMETVRQRFAYRDPELVLDALKFYSGVCTGAQYTPEGMKTQMCETLRAMISHVSQLFHPSVQLDDPKLLLHCIELLELVAQRNLDDYTSTYLRKFVISTLDNCTILRESGNGAILSAMVTIVLHVWMHAAVVSKSTNQQVWIELTIAIRRWLVNPSDSKVVGTEVIHCWKRELRFASCLMMYVMDEGNSMLKVAPDGAMILPQIANPKDGVRSKEPIVKMGYIQAAANFFMESVTDVREATLLLDRVLHLIPPATVAALPPFLHLSVYEGLLQLVELWIDSAISTQRSTPTKLCQISPSTIIALFGEWFLPACELESEAYTNSRCVAIVILCKLSAVRCVNGLTRSHLTTLSRVLFKGITSTSGLVITTVLQKAARLFTLNLDGINALVPSFLHAIDRFIISNIWEKAQKSKVKQSIWNSELNASLDVLFSIISLPKRFPKQDFVSWKSKVERVRSVQETSTVSELVEIVPESDESFHTIVGRVLVRIASLPFTDIVDIQKRAYWGLYFLVVTSLQNMAEPIVDANTLTDWIVQLIEACHSVDFTISMTALTILQDLSDFHAEINALEPVLIPRIVMTLAVFAQQQVEEASIEVQSAIESMGQSENHNNGSLTGDKPSNASSGGGARNSAVNAGSRRGSESKPNRHDEGSDHFSKLKNKLKASGSAPALQSTPLPPIPVPVPQQNAPKDIEIPALKLIVQKTSAIFECLRFWVMHRYEVLQDPDVKKILFSAIEAALVGTLPDGGWQDEVVRARELERRMSMPLLFLGLQMRATLDTDTSASSLKYFEETAVAAEGLLMHLLHHINGFPSPAGVDQMVSTCSELSEMESKQDKGDDESGSNDAEDSSPCATLSFVFMNSIIVSVVGSMDSPCARIVARDMTGLFTWEIAPLLPRAPEIALASDNGIAKRKALIDAKEGIQQLVPRRADAGVRVEFKPGAEKSSSSSSSSGTCQTCGGEKSRSKALEQSASLLGTKLETAQIPWEKEEAIISNGVCAMKTSYVFHEEPITAKPPAPARPPEGDRPPSGLNRDERQERMEKVAKMSEERNSTGLHAKPSTAGDKPKRCECHQAEKKSSKRRRHVTSICSLFDMDPKEPNVGSLDDERCVLDLVIDSVPMVYRDCGGDTTDKTLLGGRYSMLKYNLMDLREYTSPLLTDSADIPGFSFLQRLIHDEECYQQLKAFIVKEGGEDGKELVDFCDAVKKFERTNIPSDRIGQASIIYWEFLAPEGGKGLEFPADISVEVQKRIQQAQRAYRIQDADNQSLPGSLFQPAMQHLESNSFESSGLLDRYVASLDQSTSGSSSSSSIPSQLALFDSFSIMELNARISHLALNKRHMDEQCAAITRPISDKRRLGMSSSQVNETRVAALDICRLFLAQSGLLPSQSQFSPSAYHVKLLESGGKVERSFKHLDKTPTRETMKIGVIYVGPDQKTQQELLCNERGSADYTRFLAQLGWEVDLATHRGFSGGLDCNAKSLSNGPKSLYYANAHSEVAFHVVTMMPTKEADPQQIDKKRHVGNDYVHIVWSENDHHEYDPATITSHFNDVQIVIYPLRKSLKGLYLIRIHSKDRVPAFGPLLPGMIVHRADLVHLVRQTAMNANRVCRSQTSIYVRPYPTRKKLVDEIVDRYACDFKESQLLGMLFTQPPTSPTSSTPNPAQGAAIAAADTAAAAAAAAASRLNIE